MAAWMVSLGTALAYAPAQATVVRRRSRCAAAWRAPPRAARPGLPASGQADPGAPGARGRPTTWNRSAPLPLGDGRRRRGDLRPRSGRPDRAARGTALEALRLGTLAPSSTTLAP